MGAVVSRAEAVLGSALSDADLLRRWLSDPDDWPPDDRDALTVPLGLLRAPPSPSLTLRGDPADPKTTAALIVYVALGVDDTDERLQSMIEIHRNTLGQARALAEKAVLRTQLHSGFSILD